MQNLFDEISKMSHKLHSNSDRYKEVWSFLFVILRKIRIRWNFKSCLLFKWASVSMSLILQRKWRSNDTVSVSFTGISKRDSFACVLCTRDKPSHFIGSQIFYNFCAFQVMSLYHLYFSPFPFLFHNIIIGVRSVFGVRFFSSFVLFVHFIWPAPLNHWEICFRTNKAIRSEWGGGAHTIKIKFIWMQKQKQMCLYTLIFIYLFCKSSPQNSRGESILLSLMLLCVYVRCNIAGKKKLSCMKIGMK